MELKDNGREVLLSTIFGTKMKFLISDIIKGEYFMQGDNHYYTFCIRSEEPMEFIIDYPERMKYPKTLAQILSGRNIVTPNFDPEVVHDDATVPYEASLYAKEVDKKIARHEEAKLLIEQFKKEQNEGAIPEQYSGSETRSKEHV